MSTQEYQDKKKRTAPEIWSAEYMQEPVDIGGRLFNDIKYTDPDVFETIYKNSNIKAL